DDISSKAACLDVAAPIVAGGSGVHADGRAPATRGCAARFLLIQRAEKAGDDLASSTGINRIGHRTGKYGTVADRPNLDMRGGDQLIQEVTQGAEIAIDGDLKRENLLSVPVDEEHIGFTLRYGGDID